MRMRGEWYCRFISKSPFRESLTVKQSLNYYVGTEMQMRILHILSDKAKRIRPLENLVSGLESDRFSQVICYLRGDNDEHTEFEAWGHEVIGLNISPTRYRGFQPSVVFELARIIKEQKIDIVHCQRHKPTFYGTLAAYLAGEDVKVISHVRGLNRTRTFRRRLLNRLLFKRIARIIAVSNGVREDIVKSNSIAIREKVVTVYNGINVEPFLDSGLAREQARIRLDLPPKQGFVYGTVGRLVETKGQKVLLRAFATVFERYPDSWLIFAGAGRLESKLRGLATDLDIHERVVFLGFRSDIPEILKAYDVFVLPSIAEGLPGALLEAMAAGIPVIASRVGGVPEILNSPDLGVMVSPSAVDELSMAMKQLRSMDEIGRDELGKALRQRVLEQFTKGKMVSAMTEEYMKVMGEDMAGQRTEDRG
jgi:glycosyltransferase involved in cell wall biosynthesis